MKTLIEKFTETVRLTATNFCLTDGLNRDGIDSISFTQLNGDWQDIFTANHVV